MQIVKASATLEWITPKPMLSIERPYVPDVVPGTLEAALVEIERLQEGICVVAHYFEDGDEHDNILRWCYHECGELDLDKRVDWESEEYGG